MTVVIDDGMKQTRIDEAAKERIGSGRVFNRQTRRPAVEQPDAGRRQTEHAEWGAPEQCGTVGATTSVGIKYPSLPLFRHEPNVRGTLMDPKTAPETAETESEELVEEELLVEEISIDGMCGVY